MKLKTKSYLKTLLKVKQESLRRKYRILDTVRNSVQKNNKIFKKKILVEEILYIGELQKELTNE